MPYNIIKEPHGSYKKFFGHVTGAEFLQSVFENHGDPRFDQMQYTINDLLEIESHAITLKSFEIAVTRGTQVAERNPTRKIAVVTADPLIAQHVGEYASRGHQRIEVFERLEDARHWAHA